MTSRDPCDHRKVPRRAKRICATRAAPEPRSELPTFGFFGLISVVVAEFLVLAEVLVGWVRKSYAKSYEGVVSVEEIGIQSWVRNWRDECQRQWV